MYFLYRYNYLISIPIITIIVLFSFIFQQFIDSFYIYNTENMLYITYLLKKQYVYAYFNYTR
ncbi:MAG: hypothetical protein C4541_12795 [Candidatus Auribacter fodinae]|uniref:Uncharacterized protein n=1 Tax=Candidatus Auribacter fodinae TaxID=2093366 RepID=A0A3A4QVU7_9BACT|nr:MAG: hypothetical protein C4541_12795 [Candidatus Auribacter fodinae]